MIAPVPVDEKPEDVVDEHPDADDDDAEDDDVDPAATGGQHTIPSVLPKLKGFCWASPSRD